MSEQGAHQTMTAAEVEAFARKLDAWSLGLTQSEQAFLLEILERAASGDVQGSIMKVPGNFKYTNIVLKRGFAPDSQPSAGWLLPAVGQIASQPEQE